MFEYSDESIQKLIDGIYSGSISEYNLPESLYNALAKYYRKGLYSGFGMTLADATGKDLELLTELRENVYMFSAAKTYQQTKEIQSLLIDDEGNLRTAREFNKLGKQTFELWNDTWGTTEYNTCVGQAQQASKWNEIEANKEALPLLRYSAVMDPNTSEICAPLNGIVAPVDDKIWNRIAPLNHFNCRCVLLQEESGKVTPESEKLKAVKEVEGNMQDVFKMNPGKDGYIFKNDHPYFEVAAKDKGFARENFGLPIPSVQEELKKEPTIKKKSDSENIKTVKKEIEKTSFTESEKKAIYTYTQGNYTQINEFLRGQSFDLSQDNFGTIKEMISYIDKSPKIEIESYRGLAFETKKGFDEFHKLKTGDVFTDKGFVSTTYDKKIGKSFTNSDEYQVHMSIKGKNGVLVEHLSDTEKEKEILFNRNTNFKIESIKNVNSKRIEMTLIEL